MGPLGKGHRSEASRGVPPDLLGPELRVGEEGDAERDDAVGVRLPPLLVEPVVPGPGDGQPQLRSLATENTRPQNPVICDGKLSDAQTPLMSMSAMRASMSQQPGRMCSKRIGSSVTHSGRRPATAFIPTCV